MEHAEMPTTKSVGMKWGIILAVISIVWFLVVTFGGLTGNTAVSWLGILPTIIVIFLAHKEFKDSGDGYMSYGQGLGIGMIAAAISTVTYALFLYIYVAFIDGSYIDTIRDMQISGWQESGMSDAEIEQALSFSEGFMTPESMALMGVIVGLLAGFVISLIVSAITKNSNPELEV